MARFLYASKFAESPATLFAWHARPGALTRLTPPWQGLRRLDPEAPLAEGQKVRLQLRLGPWSIPWTALHRDLVADQQFVDQMVQGPFADWVHRHRFLPVAQGCELRDELAWSLPGGRLVEALAEPVMRSMLARAFRYRHRILRADLLRHRTWSDRPRLQVAVTGATGMIGRQLCAFLSTGGHRVLHVTRRPRPGSSDIGWNPREGRLDSSALEGLDAVIHLAGQGIAGRWTPQHKNEVLRSRVEGTQLVARSLAGLQHPPKVLVTASAIGFYGDRGDEVLEESSPGGSGFLADVVRRWEAAADPAREAGIGVASFRSGLVLTPTGGAAGRLLPLFRLGVGGRLGSGRQWWSWISLVDETRAILHLLESNVTGPVNLTAEPARNSEVTRALGAALHRPTALPVPAFALRAVLGEFSADVLGSLRVVPSVLQAEGFTFHHPTIQEAAAWLASSSPFARPRRPRRRPARPPVSRRGGRP